MLLRVSIQGIFGAIGRFAVRFRWFILVAWVIAAVAVPRFLPSLASVTQGNNANFLPASAPSQHATDLAKPFGVNNLTPVPVVAAASQGTLTVGRTVVDTHYRNLKEPNCHVAFGADREKFCDFLEATLALGPRSA